MFIQGSAVRELYMTSETIIHAFPTEWISISGVPGSTLTDNGREFYNSGFRSLAENYGIFIKTTAAESPWSNGVCKGHNAVLRSLFEKLQNDNNLKLPERTLVHYCCFAKKCLSNKDGFSPQQIVFGQNPQLPNVMELGPPGLEKLTTSEEFRQHLLVLKRSREEYTSMKNDGRIKKALKAKLRMNETLLSLEIEFS